MKNQTLLQTNIAAGKVHHGKVRDIYDLENQLLIVATDRISAFDVIMANAIPFKGQVLTQISKFWFDFLSPDIENHLISSKLKDFPAPFNSHSELAKRSMLVRKTQVLPIECIVRGYITGSGWTSYQQTGKICGYSLPQGLKQCQKLPEPLFTPSTKAEIGFHDENITLAQCEQTIGKEATDYISAKSIEIFEKASRYALQKGIILADTKFEWGVIDGKIILIDEVLTPDSSRFWALDQYQAGKEQQSYDKQFVRDYLEEINFDKSGAGITLPEDIVHKTSLKYIECYEKLTGSKFEY